MGQRRVVLEGGDVLPHQENAGDGHQSGEDVVEWPDLAHFRSLEASGWMPLTLGTGGRSPRLPRGRCSAGRILLRDDPAPPPGRENRCMIRVLIADDQTLVRTGFRVILEAEGDIEVV